MKKKSPFGLGTTRRPAKKANSARLSKAPMNGGKRTRTGPKMGGVFNLSAKKPEPDQPPRTLSAVKGTNSRAARMKRLDGRQI